MLKFDKFINYRLNPHRKKILLSFSSLAVMIFFLAVTFIGAQQKNVYRSKAYDSGASTTVNPDGSKTTVYSNGGSVTVMPDGSQIITSPGSGKTFVITTLKPNGSTSSVSIMSGDGEWEIINNSDGSKAVYTNGGKTVTKFDKNGKQTYSGPNTGF